MNELENLRPEVRKAIKNFDDLLGGFGDPREFRWQTIRAELLQRALLEKQLRDAYAKQHEALQGWVQRATDAESELAALKARIAKAPICEFRQPHDDEVDEDGYGYYAVPLSIVGKTARLLVVEE